MFRPGSRSFSTSTPKSLRAIRSMDLSVSPDSFGTTMPAAAHGRFSRTSRCATRSFTVQSPHSVGASSPTVSARSQSS